MRDAASAMIRWLINRGGGIVSSSDSTDTIPLSRKRRRFVCSAKAEERAGSDKSYPYGYDDNFWTDQRPGMEAKRLTVQSGAEKMG